MPTNDKLPVSDPAFWKARLQNVIVAEKPIYIAVYDMPAQTWECIRQDHAAILSQKIKPKESILDAGCAYGRLLELLPGDWQGDYLGIDISPDFIELAKKAHPNHTFMIGDLCDLSSIANKAFDWAVLISVEGMVEVNLGKAVWLQMKEQITRVAKRTLLLDYEQSSKAVVLRSSEC